MLETLATWFIDRDLDADAAFVIARTLLLVLTLIFALALDFVAKKILVSTLHFFITKTKSKWDDVLLEKKVFNRLAHLAPAIVIYVMVPQVFSGYDLVVLIFSKLILIYMILVGIFVIDSILNAVHDIYETFDTSKEVPIKGFLQVIKLFIFFISLIFIISLTIGKSPLYLISGLGALTAVLMLVFKDTIMGFVAGIQLIANKMIRKGDWIEMPKYGADGDVMEMTLTTVKVKNFDNTITTIPTYALISDSFKNWRGMQESGGRRIKRAIKIDLNSITFLDAGLLENLKKINILKDYIEEKQNDLDEYNKDHNTDLSLVNGRRLTNIGTFRAYMENYLTDHPLISKELTLLVRHLAPDSEGIAIEIYVFSTDKDWINYEKIQADIFDHFFAVMPEFNLKPFQNPTGGDFRNISK